MLQPKYFKTKYAKTVSLWVREYYDRYKQAPGKIIQTIFQEKRAGIPDDDEVESISDFLASLSDEYDTTEPISNVEYEIETATKTIKLRSIELLREDLEKSIVEGDPTKGEAVIANYSRVGRPDGDTISILDNKMDVIDSFTQEDEILFTLPGVLKKTVGPFMRGDLSAFIGKPKGKKSFALMFTAEQAMMSGCRVVFFTLEMRKKQIIRRAWQAITASPMMDRAVDIPRFDCVISSTVPTSGPRDDGDAVYAVVNEKKQKKAWRLEDIEDIQANIRKRFGGGDCRFIALPAYSATIEDLTAHLDNLAWYEGYVPDVVIVDYADIVRPSKGSGTEYRHQIDSIWKGLRALAQTRNIHVVTASQTNRAGLKGDIELENIAEDMRKLAHVSLLVALNQTAEERDMNVMRLKTLLNRDDGVIDGNEAVVLQQLSIGKFYLDSKLRRNVEKIE